LRKNTPKQRFNILNFLLKCRWAILKIFWRRGSTSDCRSILKSVEVLKRGALLKI